MIIGAHKPKRMPGSVSIWRHCSVFLRHLSDTLIYWCQYRSYSLTTNGALQHCLCSFVFFAPFSNTHLCLRWAEKKTHLKIWVYQIWKDVKIVKWKATTIKWWLSNLYPDLTAARRRALSILCQQRRIYISCFPSATAPVLRAPGAAMVRRCD